jgi:hypothetical protein
LTYFTTYLAIGATLGIADIQFVQRRRQNMPVDQLKTLALWTLIWPIELLVKVLR